VAVAAFPRAGSGAERLDVDSGGTVTPTSPTAQCPFQLRVWSRSCGCRQHAWGAPAHKKAPPPVSGGPRFVLRVCLRGAARQKALSDSRTGLAGHAANLAMPAPRSIRRRRRTGSRTSRGTDRQGRHLPGEVGPGSVTDPAMQCVPSRHQPRSGVDINCEDRACSDENSLRG
jgi:hypothetical protein